MRYDIANGGPNAEHCIGKLPENFVDVRYDGNFYQPDDVLGCDIRRLRAAPYKEGALDASHPNHPGLMPFSTYQDWVELDWKTPHGTYETVQRLGKKIIEEGLEESRAEFEEAWDDKVAGRTPANRQKIIDEIGDVLWVTTALASNSGISLDEAVRTYLHQHDLMRLSSPEPVQLVHADYIVSGPNGFIPSLGPYDDPADDYLDFDEMDPGLKMLDIAVGMMVASEKHYGYGYERFTPGAFEKTRREIIPQVGEAVTLLAYLTNRWANSSLAEVAQASMRKVDDRVMHNLVDKTDGERPPGL